MSERFQDPQQSLDVFSDEDTLVVCPRCGGCALSRKVDGADPSSFAPRRLSCRHCGYTKDWDENGYRRHARTIEDDYFQLPLWLQAPCCGEVLWAYGLRHLTFLEQFIGADLRERERDPKWGWSNKSLVSRLPLWMKAAKNRDEILRVLALLRRRAEAV